MTGGRRFSPPDWGHDHLSLDAVVAYVDDELGAGAHTRAEAHLACCAECRAEVVAQRQARAALRAAAGPCLPSSLLRSLRSIPVEAELPPPPPGLGITADGQFVLLRDVPRAPAERCGPADAPAEPEPGAPARRFSRRARVGAVSGLALGALAVGAFAVPGPAAPPGPGVLGGAVLDVPVQARLSAVPAVVGRDEPGPAATVPAASSPASDPSQPAGPTSTTAPAGPTAGPDGEPRERPDRSPTTAAGGP
jgi:anti-sigma factor RsiW